MSEFDWKYYNHAVIPTCPPHATPDTEIIESGKIWEIFPNALLARWTSDYDCGHETDWWYVIKDGGFDIEDLPKVKRKHIRQALKKCRVEKIDCTKHLSELYEVYKKSFERYKSADNELDYDSWTKSHVNKNYAYFAAFTTAEDKLIGYFWATEYEDYVTLNVAKFIPEYLNLQPSEALYAFVLDYYLNRCGKRYISSGERSINHVTNTQEYKIKTFAYRKAYCKLNVVYNPKIKPIIKLIYPIRKLFAVLDFIKIVHQLNAVLKMEEIVRNE